MNDPAFLARKQEAERAERERPLDRARMLYLELTQSTSNDSQRADARLKLAAVLRRLGQTPKLAHISTTSWNFLRILSMRKATRSLLLQRRLGEAMGGENRANIAQEIRRLRRRHAAGQEEHREAGQDRFHDDAVVMATTAARCEEFPNHLSAWAGRIQAWGWGQLVPKSLGTVISSYGDEAVPTPIACPS